MRLVQAPGRDRVTAHRCGTRSPAMAAPPCEGFETAAPLDPPTPDMLGAPRNVPKICAGFPCAGPAQPSPAARTAPCSVGDHLRLLAGRGAKVSVPAAGQLCYCLPAVGRRAGVGSPRRGAAEPSRRDSARLQPQPPPAQPQVGAAGVNLEAWEGLALSPGPPEAGT